MGRAGCLAAGVSVVTPGSLAAEWQEERAKIAGKTRVSAEKMKELPVNLSLGIITENEFNMPGKLYTRIVMVGRYAF